MMIHVVKQGDTIYSIAQRYGVSAQNLIAYNELTDPENLVLGQTIVVLFPEIVYTIQEGDTLASIAAQFNTTVIQLLRNNRQITDTFALYPGVQLVIRYQGEKIGSMVVNGYAYPSIDRQLLRKTLPYLTYITLFTYGITPEGELIPIDDQEIIDIAREYGVGPLMLISSLTQEGTFSNELAHLVLNDSTVQENLINNILENLQAKNYFGLDVDFEFVYPDVYKRQFLLMLRFLAL